ncbi:unnamed protein product [Clavelina lepadiformis]|uniref:Stabilizer of axonemal microtubules 2 n=1 Tax=Clavelina lepadiformis TaxID=159417 RepID=A0ABP0FBF6_CLALP
MHYRNDYITHPLSKHEPPPKAFYVPPSTSMQGASTYTQDYPGHGVCLREFYGQKEVRRLPIEKFDANPTYLSDYKKWALPPRIQHRPNNKYEKPSVSMEQSSTSQRDYRYQFAPPRESAQPSVKAMQSNEPLQSHTEHSTSFIPHEIKCRSVTEKEKYVMPEVPMALITTFQTDYTGAKSLPAETMRPVQTSMVSNCPLASSSEFRDNFVAWPTVSRKPNAALTYEKPKGNIDFQTTQRLNFSSPNINLKPTTTKQSFTYRPPDVPLDCATQYNNSFKKWNLESTSPRMRQKLQDGTTLGGKFEGQSTMKEHFVHHQNLKHVQSCKPTDKGFSSHSPLDDDTIYKVSYVPQSMKEVERYPTPDWLKQREIVQPH